jgi:DNA processing protein
VTDTERLARVALSRLTEPGDLRMLPLVSELGAARVHAHLAAERGPDDLLTDVAERLGAMDPARDLEQAERLGIRFVVPGDEEWPRRVDDLVLAAPVHERGGAPLGLWVRGPVGLHELEASVAVVGSRSATSYGADLAAEIGAVLARNGQTVISGGAYGIDQAAHRGALAMGGPSVAVLACGVDRAYPAAHKSLLDHLAATGAVVSELPPGCAPTRLRFLVRNRLIAALTTGTVVVEAAVRSGALNTANWAGRLLRPVMGVPGPVASAPSEGVHQLIRSGAATLVTSGAEVLEVVSPAGDHLAERPRGQDRARDRLTLRHQQVLDAVPVARDAAADSIARTAGIGLMEVRSALTRLHAMGLVEGTASGWRLADAART